jgi:carbonic anhydrase/acetyltransferase-like protein (isoleucine patch superfamily)
VQDNATVHCTYKKFPTVIGDNVSIGHNAIVHGCTIENNVLIGMGAIVMDDCVVGEGCIVAAGSVVTQGKKLAPGTLWAGVPAKEIGLVPERLRTGEIERIANNYLKYSSWYTEE